MMSRRRFWIDVSDSAADINAMTGVSGRSIVPLDADTVSVCWRMLHSIR